MEKTITEKLDEQLSDLETKTARRTGVSVAQLRAEKEEFDRMVANGEDKTPKAKAPKKAKPTKTAKAKAPKKGKAKKTPATGQAIRALALAKVRYKERGDVTSCGDWLATTLKEEFLHTVPKQGQIFDLDGFVKCCKENGLDVKEKWAINRAPGWQGRLRMNGRQKLEIVLAREGHILIDGKRVKPTGVFLKAMEKKHPIVEDLDDGSED